MWPECGDEGTGRKAEGQTGPWGPGHPSPSLEAQLVSYEQANTKKTFTPLFQRIFPCSSGPFIISVLREYI